MSTTEKLIKARMGMLALAEQLNNVSAACRLGPRHYASPKPRYNPDAVSEVYLHIFLNIPLTPVDKS